MTIHRSGNPEADLAYYHCVQCNADKVVDIPPAAQPLDWIKEILRLPTSMDVWTSSLIERSLNGQYLPPSRGDTKGRAENQVKTHNYVRPDHDIHIIFFDGDHPIDS